MKLAITTIALAALASTATAAQNCVMSKSTAQGCDWNQWTQQRRTTVNPGASVRVDCYRPGTNVAGGGNNNRWNWVGNWGCYIWSGHVKCDNAVPACS